jgi:hypothetical protein
MELKEYKTITDINKKFYKVIGIKCDCCNQNIKEKEEYLEVNYREDKYDEGLKYKQFCIKCMKDNMFDMFMNNYYANFNKYDFIKDEKWKEDYTE